MVRVLHVLSTLNIGSGIANFVMNYYKKIDREKIQFDFLLFSEPENTYTNDVQKLGARVYYIPKPSLKNMFKYKQSIDDFFASHKGEWEVIHLHEVLVQSVVLPAAKRIGIEKRFVHAHGGNIRISAIKRVRNFFLEFNMLKNANRFVACSDHAAKAEFGGKVKYEVINNAIDIERYIFSPIQVEQIKKELGINGEQFIVGTVGRMSIQKNPIFMVEIMKKIINRIPNALFLYIGDGEMREDIVREINNSGLNSKFILLGNRKDCNVAMQAIDCFVFPSIFEGLGIAAIEAEASGIYVLASDRVPKITKVCNRIEYLPLEEDLWASRIIELQKLGTFKKVNALEYMKESIYSISQNIKRLEELYLN